MSWIAIGAAIVGVASGGLLALYLLGWLGLIVAELTIWKAAIVSFAGGMVAWLVDFYTQWMAFLEIGLTFSNVFYSIFTIGYIVLLGVMIFNLADTATDGKKNNLSLVR